MSSLESTAASGTGYGGMSHARHRLNSVGLYIGFVGVIIFALSGALSMAGMNIGAGLMLIGLASQGRTTSSRLFDEPLVLSIVALIAYILIRAGIAAWRGEAGADHWEEAWDLIRAGGMMGIILGWWLYVRPNWTRGALTLALASGLIAFAAALLDAPRLPWNANVRLITFGSPQAFGAYAALLLVGVTAMTPAVIGACRRHWRWGIASAWILAGVLPAFLGRWGCGCRTRFAPWLVARYLAPLAGPSVWSARDYWPPSRLYGDRDGGLFRGDRMAAGLGDR